VFRDDAPAVVEVELPDSGRQLHPIGEVSLHPVVELGRLGPDTSSDPLGLDEPGATESDGRRTVGMGALDGPDHRSTAGGELDSPGEFVVEVGPQVGVVLVTVVADAGAVHGEHRHGRQRTEAAPVGLGVDPLRDLKGWAFRTDAPGTTGDPVNGFEYLSEAYERTQSGYDDRVSVPVLWDRKSGQIVNNESSEIIVMLDGAFNEWAAHGDLDLYPEPLRAEIDEINDWVYRDRGLPDLTIVNVTPRQLEAHNGLPDGWLVAIDVRNDGDAIADVPVTVRSNAGHALGHSIAPGSSGSAATETQRLRIPGHSSVSRRIVFTGMPDEVQVNDGSVPETRTSIHTRQLVLPTK